MRKHAIAGQNTQQTVRPFSNNRLKADYCLLLFYHFISWNISWARALLALKHFLLAAFSLLPKRLNWLLTSRNLAFRFILFFLMFFSYFNMSQPQAARDIECFIPFHPYPINEVFSSQNFCSIWTFNLDQFSNLSVFVETKILVEVSK